MILVPDNKYCGVLGSILKDILYCILYTHYDNQSNFDNLLPSFLLDSTHASVRANFQDPMLFILIAKQWHEILKILSK